MPISWEPFVEFVRTHQRFLVMTHVRPDGDAIGSQIGLACALQQLGKSARIVVASNLGPRYEFLNRPDLPIERFQPPVDAFRNIDAIIVVDTGTWNQLGDFGPFMQSLPVGKCVIDHHRTQDDLGGIRLVDIQAEAAGRLVVEATHALGVPLTPRSADALFMALATDTGWFRHANTTPRTFSLASELTAAGADPQRIYEEIYERSNAGRLRLTGRALDRLEIRCDGRLAFTSVYLSDFAETGGVPPDTEDLINYPRSIAGCEIALVFIEQIEGKTKVSFRAKEPHDVSALAEQFGGGGHKMAAGATVASSMPEAMGRVLSAAEALLKRP